jgi:phosphatidylinositol alpha-1,6-mannosyltransferase
MSGTRRWRVLAVTRNLPPLIGGMERLNWHMAAELSRSADVRIIAPQGSAAWAPAGTRTREVPLWPLAKFLLAAQWRAWCEARQGRPDIVLAGCGLTAVAAWFAARFTGSRVAAYVHGLDLVVRHPFYRALWLPVLRRMDRVTANSMSTAQLARDVGVAPERLAIVPSGVDIPEPDPSARARFRQRWNLAPDAPVLLSVGRLSARKGLGEFVRVLRPGAALLLILLFLYPIHDAPYDDQRYTRHGLERALAGVGFEIVALSQCSHALETAALHCPHRVLVLFAPAVATLILILTLLARALARFWLDRGTMAAAYAVEARR